MRNGNPINRMKARLAAAAVVPTALIAFAPAAAASVNPTPAAHHEHVSSAPSVQPDRLLAHPAAPAHKQTAHHKHSANNGHRARPYHFYDSAHPAGIPHGQAAAVYATGNYVAYPSDTKRLGHVIWIDVTGTDYEASTLDSEPGNADCAQAGRWAEHRLAEYLRQVARIYMSKSDWPACRAAVRRDVPKAERSRVHWWVADPTGYDHIVPGADATQWKWAGGQYDESTARPGF